jgi:threonine dehydrogenase-like Zn-dependent dehydrogenase
MRALVFHGPGRLSVEERPDPAARDDDVLLHVIAVGICGSDLHGYTGENGRRAPGQVMGHEMVCRVLSADTGQTHLSPGQLVTVNPVLGCRECGECREHRPQRCLQRRVIGVDPAISAAFAERLAVPARNVVPLPGTLPVPLGALVEPLAVGWHAAAQAAMTSEDRVLVIGGGPIGQAAALAARRLGAAQILVCELDPHRRAFLSRLGFQVVPPDGDELSRAASAMPGGPPSVVMDAVGSTDSLAIALTHSAIGARICLLGMNMPTVALQAYAISTAERSVVGSFCYDEIEFADTAGWVASSQEDLSLLADGHVTLDEAPDAFRRLASQELKASKILVYPNGLE